MNILFIWEQQAYLLINQYPLFTSLKIIQNHIVLVLSYSFNQPKKLQWTDRQTLPFWPGSPCAPVASTKLICSRFSLTRCEADKVGGEHTPPSTSHPFPQSAVRIFLSSAVQLEICPLCTITAFVLPQTF